MTPRKEIRELLMRLPGWSYGGPTKGGHVRLLHDETGVAMIIAHSASDHRARANTIKLAGRLAANARERVA